MNFHARLIKQDKKGLYINCGGGKYRPYNPKRTKFNNGETPSVVFNGSSSAAFDGKYVHARAMIFKDTISYEEWRCS